jgi:hypothetical protein
MRPSDAKDPETGKKVQVTASFLVEEIGALAALVEAVEADRSKHADKLRVDVSRVEAEVLASIRQKDLIQIERHQPPPAKIVLGR